MGKLTNAVISGLIVAGILAFIGKVKFTKNNDVLQKKSVFNTNRSSINGTTSQGSAVVNPVGTLNVSDTRVRQILKK